VSVRTLFTISFLALVVTAGAGTAGAGGDRAREEPSPLVGATYRFSAASGALTAAGRGQLDLGGKFVATVRASRKGSGETVTIVARVMKFWLNYLVPRKRLTLTLEVTQGSSRCPKGSRGSAVLVDDEGADSVLIRFGRKGCSRFASSWASGARGQRLTVSIVVHEESSEPSSNLSRVAPAGGGEPGFGGRRR
jgi:hypothetical protein